MNTQNGLVAEVLEHSELDAQCYGATLYVMERLTDTMTRERTMANAAS